MKPEGGLEKEFSQTQECSKNEVERICQSTSGSTHLSIKKKNIGPKIEHKFNPIKTDDRTLKP